MCLCKRNEFTVFALLGAVCTSIADLFRCTPAKSSTHVQSQTKLLPPPNGKTAEGRDPSPLSNPGGSKIDARPAFWTVLLITSFIAECLGNRQHCIFRTSHANLYCPSSHRSGVTHVTYATIYVNTCNCSWIQRECRWTAVVKFGGEGYSKGLRLYSLLWNEWTFREYNEELVRW